MHLDRVWRDIPAQLARLQDSGAAKFKGVIPGNTRYSHIANVIEFVLAGGDSIQMDGFCPKFNFSLYSKLGRQLYFEGGMSKIQYMHKKVSELTKSEWQGIITLHHDTFALTDNIIRAELEKRDYVYLYSEKKTHKIIGCIGIQWIHTENSTILYMGNAVIYPQYKNHRILSTVQLHSMLWSIIRYPTRHLYAGALLLTPESFGYLKHFVQYWPHSNEKPPQYVRTLMLSMANTLVGNHYHMHNNAIICDALAKQIHHHNIYKKSINKKYLPIINEFRELNPKYKQGEQLLAFGKISVLNILLLISKNIIFIMRQRLYNI